MKSIELKRTRWCEELTGVDLLRHLASRTTVVFAFIALWLSPFSDRVSNYSDALKPVHERHAVVAKDDLVHGQSGAISEPVFNQVDSLLAVDCDG